ncbi:extracellular solute-binding protein [Paenibacillus cymbidii]|uniref:extracellular solute-binding protein n=1 Tax=Paenibacillus cymbidii TaxID=1639034 RepID=UPI001436950A|nr:extracellular solute-binding protein [Paenibacillus cymbidii]
MKQISARSIGMAGTLSLALLAAACSSDTGNSSAPASTAPPSSGTSAASSAPVEPLGKYDPPIDMTFVKVIDQSTKFKEGESIDNNAWTKIYKERLGINVKFDWTVTGTEDQYFQKLNVSIASGTIPDSFMVNAQTLAKLVEAGQIEDLTPVFEKYLSANSRDLFYADGGRALKAATFGGKLMALPSIQSEIDNTFVLWVRTDWLKKLNLPEPKTMADVFKISEAFTNQDPDGNGKKDTFGLGVDKLLWDGFPGLDGFFNSFHAYPNMWVPDASGKLVSGNTQPEMKAALAKLQEMYKAGQIDKEFGIKDSAKVAESLNSGKLGMYYGQAWTPLWPMQDGKNLDPGMEWQAYPLPSIDGKPAKAQSTFPIKQYFVVKKGFKHPEALVKLMNLWKDNEIKDNEKIYGQDGGIPIFKYAVTAGADPHQNLKAYLKVDETLKSKDTSKLTPGEKIGYDNIQKFLNGDQKLWGNYLVFGPNSSYSIINKYLADKLIQYDAFYGAPTETMGEKTAALNKLQLESFTKIIMGEAPIDNFDKYVNDYNKLGGEQMTQEVNAWYAKQAK